MYRDRTKNLSELVGQKSQKKKITDVCLQVQKGIDMIFSKAA
jgi:hypothetical protein